MLCAAAANDEPPRGNPGLDVVVFELFDEGASYRLAVGEGRSDAAFAVSADRLAETRAAIGGTPLGQRPPEDPGDLGWRTQGRDRL
jgi:hypothetical protein